MANEYKYTSARRLQFYTNQLKELFAQKDIATVDLDGLMSALDKIKLNNIATGATKVEVPTEGEGKIEINGTEKTVIDIDQLIKDIGGKNAIHDLGDCGTYGDHQGVVDAIIATGEVSGVGVYRQMAGNRLSGLVIWRSALNGISDGIALTIDEQTISLWDWTRGSYRECIAEAVLEGFFEHPSDTDNPHEVTKAQVGLGNVDNTSDANKQISNAAQTALDKKVDKVSGKGLSSNDYTTADKTKLGGIAAGADVSPITNIKRNNVTVTPTNKSVNIEVPTLVSELTNDSNFQTLTQVQAAISAAGHMSKEQVDVLPATGAENIIYLVPDPDSEEEDNIFLEYWWVNNKWERIGSTATHIDLTGYVKESQLVEVTEAEILAMFA